MLRFFNSRKIEVDSLVLFILVNAKKNISQLSTRGRITVSLILYRKRNSRTSCRMTRR